MLSSNRGITNGGGIYNLSFLFGDQVTVTQNAAGLGGGGIYNYSPSLQSQSAGILWLTQLTLSDNQANVMGGHYPSGGINIGPAMTFGYIAGRQAAGVTEYENVLPELINDGV